MSLRRRMYGRMAGWLRRFGYACLGQADAFEARHQSGHVSFATPASFWKFDQVANSQVGANATPVFRVTCGTIKPYPMT